VVGHVRVVGIDHWCCAPESGVGDVAVVGLVVLRVVAILSMHWRWSRAGCRGVHRRLMLVVHGRQGRRRVVRDVALRRIRHARRVWYLVGVLLLMRLLTV